MAEAAANAPLPEDEVGDRGRALEAPSVTDEVVQVLRARLSDMLELAPADIELDLDADLFSVDGYEVGGEELDSLSLMDLVCVLEDAFDVSLHEVVETADQLTLRSVIEVIDAADRGR